MNTTRTLIALASLLLLAAPLAACGGSSGGSTGAPGIEGVYVLDVERTPPVATGGEAPRQLDSARKAALASEFSSSAYRVEIRPDATFRTSIALTEEPLTFAGTWTRNGSVLRMVTTTINGEAPPSDIPVEEVQEDVTIEPGTLVFKDGEQVVYLKKL